MLFCNIIFILYPLINIGANINRTSTKFQSSNPNIIGIYLYRDSLFHLSNKFNELCSRKISETQSIELAYIIKLATRFFNPSIVLLIHPRLTLYHKLHVFQAYEQIAFSFIIDLSFFVHIVKISQSLNTLFVLSLSLLKLSVRNFLSSIESSSIIQTSSKVLFTYFKNVLSFSKVFLSLISIQFFSRILLYLLLSDSDTLSLHHNILFIVLNHVWIKSLHSLVVLFLLSEYNSEISLNLTTLIPSIPSFLRYQKLSPFRISILHFQNLCSVLERWSLILSQYVLITNLGINFNLFLLLFSFNFFSTKLYIFSVNQTWIYHLMNILNLILNLLFLIKYQKNLNLYFLYFLFYIKFLYFLK